MTARDTKVRQENRSAAGDYLKSAGGRVMTRCYLFFILRLDVAAYARCQARIIRELDDIIAGRAHSQDHLDVCELGSWWAWRALGKMKQLRKVIALRTWSR